VVCVHEVAERTTGSVARCSLVDDDTARAQEIPVWRPDAACCRTLRGVAHPVADMDALKTLLALVGETGATPISAADEAQEVGTVNLVGNGRDKACGTDWTH